MIRIHLPVFRATVFVYFGPKEFVQFNNFVVRSGENACNIDDADGYTNAARCWVKKPDDLTCLVHELFHVANNIAQVCEISDEECIAYILEYLYTKAAQRLEGVMGHI